MVNLKIIYQDNPGKYREVRDKIISELSLYSERVQELYQNNFYDELKIISHTLRNLAGAIGNSKLKITAAYWEEVCANRKKANIDDLRASITDALVQLQKEEGP
jgi:HPt (histidine-containing phosphotransfer) domain-containing protein